MGNDIVVTREQVKDLIKAEGLKPSDLFGRDALDTDPIVIGLAEARVEEKIGGEYRRRKVAEEKLETLRGQVDTEKAELQKQIGSLKATAAKAQLGPLFEKQRADRKLDDRQVKFIQKRLERFEPKNPEDLEKELNGYLDAEIAEYSKIAREVFGIDDKATGDGKDKSATGSEADKNKGGGGEDKYLDPAKNPMIKTD